MNIVASLFGCGLGRTPGLTPDVQRRTLAIALIIFVFAGSQLCMDMIFALINQGVQAFLEISRILNRPIDLVPDDVAIHLLATS